MKKYIPIKQAWIAEMITVALTALLVYAALAKLLAYPVFVAQLRTHPLLKYFAGFLAWAVPATELGVAALLVMPRTRLTGLFSAAALLTVFTVYLAMMLLLYKNLPCSCGGIISSLTWAEHIVFNAGFILLAAAGVRLARSLRQTCQVSETWQVCARACIGRKLEDQKVGWFGYDPHPV